MKRHPVYQRMGVSEIMRQHTMKEKKAAEKAESDKKQKKEPQADPTVFTKKEA